MQWKVSTSTDNVVNSMKKIYQKLTKNKRIQKGNLVYLFIVGEGTYIAH